MKLFSSMLAGLSLFTISCERHEFEGPDGTKQFHEHHGAAHKEHTDDHADDGKEHEAHPEKAAH